MQAGASGRNLNLNKLTNLLALFPYEYLGGSVSGTFVFLDLHGSDIYTFLSSVFLPGGRPYTAHEMHVSA